MNNKCWYQDDCVTGMNDFYDKHIKGQDLSIHMKTLTDLIAEVKGCKTVIDLGAGTAMASEYLKDFDYTGADLEHIIEGSAKRNYPDLKYVYCDVESGDISFIHDYDLVIANGLIDVLNNPYLILDDLLYNTKNYLLIHRQEIVSKGETEVVPGTGYGEGVAVHSKILRADFEYLIDKWGFEIVKELNCSFSNWENGGNSFLLKRIYV